MLLEKYLENEIDWNDDNGEPTDKVVLKKHELVALIEPLVKEAKREERERIDKLVEVMESNQDARSYADYHKALLDVRQALKEGK